MSLVVTVDGEEKHGKTSFGMTFPKPLLVLALDIGGVQRAEWRFQEHMGKDIFVHEFSLPMQTENTLADIAGLSKLKAMIGKTAAKTKPPIIKGTAELWYEFLTVYVSCLENEYTPEGRTEPVNFATLLVDTGTSMWQLCARGVLQEKQVRAAADGKYRERLQQIEYSEPNARMLAFLQAAREADKNLVMVQYLENQYGDVLQSDGSVKTDVTGKRRNGWSHLDKYIDLSVWIELIKEGDRYLPQAEVRLSGLTLSLMGMKFKGTGDPNDKEPNWDQITQALEFIRGSANAPS